MLGAEPQLDSNTLRSSTFGNSNGLAAFCVDIIMQK